MVAAAVMAAALVVALGGAAGGRRRLHPAPAGGPAGDRPRHVAVLRCRRRSRPRTCRSTTSGPGSTRGQYTSAANIGVYLWAVVAARDLHLISTHRADRLASATLTEVAGLKRYDGFLYQWYDTNNGDVLSNPGQGDCTETTPAQDNCWFVSAVDNGWYASGLIEVRQALPDERGLADQLLAPMDFSIFYDNRRADRLQRERVASGRPARPARCTAATTSTRGRRATTTARCTATRGSRCTSAWAATRCPATCGGARGGPRRRSAAPPIRSPSDPGTGYWQTYTDPQSGKRFPVWEGHYTYPGTNLTFVPTFAGGMFEGLMANLVVPETEWGPHSFGLNDVRWAEVQETYDTQELGLSGVGDVAVEHRRRHRGLRRLRRRGPGVRQQLAARLVHDLRHRDDRLPARLGDRAAGDPAAGLRQPRPAAQPATRGSTPRDGGFYDAVDPTTGSIGHRRLVLDQSMIMAGDRRRAERRRAAAVLRRRPGVVGGAGVPRRGADVDRLRPGCRTGGVSPEAG